MSLGPFRSSVLYSAEPPDLSRSSMPPPVPGACWKLPRDDASRPIQRFRNQRERESERQTHRSNPSDDDVLLRNLTFQRTCAVQCARLEDIETRLGTGSSSISLPTSRLR